MYDMSVLKKRYFSMKLKNGLRLDVEPPTVKSLKKIMKLSNVDAENFNEEDFNGLTEGLAIALSKNKQNKKISTEFIDENFTIDEIQSLLTEYFGWVDSIKNEKN